MPIVVKLSEAFYHRFGDAVVAELVGLLNQVDTSSQETLRELNEANFARFSDRLARCFSEFEVKLERRFAALEAQFEQRSAALELRIERRFADLESRLTAQVLTQTRWMIGMWASMLLAIIGLWLRH